MASTDAEKQKKQQEQRKKELEAARQERIKKKKEEDAKKALAEKQKKQQLEAEKKKREAAKKKREAAKKQEEAKRKAQEAQRKKALAEQKRRMQEAKKKQAQEEQRRAEERKKARAERASKRQKIKETRDPYLAFKFRVKLEIDGILEAGFTQCSGLDITREVESYKEGGVNHYVHQLPGRSSYSNISLKRGITYSMKLWDWYREGIMDGKVKRLNVTIILYRRDGKQIRYFNVRGAFPIKWSGPDFNTDSSQVAIETLELAHHGFNLQIKNVT